MLEPLCMSLYGAETMRAIDAAASEGLGIPGGHLMERAGVGVAREVRRVFAPDSVVVYAGKGNNGGDGFVVARELFNAGVEVRVCALAARDDYRGDARLNYDIAEKLGVPIVTGVEPVGDADVAVDAVFGTGFAGAADGVAAEAIAALNDSAAAVVTLDIASGVDASTGEVHGPAVLADLTVALHAAKIGHLVSPGFEYAGHVTVVPIGIPPSCDEPADVFAVTGEAVALLVQPKTTHDHKRSVGTVAVVGGCRGMTGAAHMAAMGALRSGAGLVHCVLPDDLAGEKPFLEVINVAAPGAGRLGVASAAMVRDEMGAMKATALGPGMGRDDETAGLVRELVAESVPLVIDADGLWALGDDLALLAARSAATVLTPHEGELARLLGVTAQEVGARRLALAREAAARSRATVLLKGARTIVADPGGHAYVVATGNPGLATPGSGDVLTGAIVAQLAKGLPATDAACLGAYVHGLAADLAVELATSSQGMIAGDLLDFLPLAVESLLEDEDDDEEFEEDVCGCGCEHDDSDDEEDL
jgi:NAD(P)H-hydrate epimerase